MLGEVLCYLYSIESFNELAMDAVRKTIITEAMKTSWSWKIKIRRQTRELRVERKWKFLFERLCA